MAIIDVVGIGKKYSLQMAGSEEPEAGELRKKFFRSKVSDAHPNQDAFWALQDISFSLEPGERLGIIGPNGSGKSTLLKILSRIISPSEGHFSFRGKLLSILEIGSGFHPDLTGLENVYLNARLNGFEESLVRKIVPEIIEFAGLEEHMGARIATYSSGMYARLAFSVAAHLPSEILLVDEVLAVGDADFQARCKQKMFEMQNKNRTLVLVSHDMNAIETVCDGVITLRKGKLVDSGNPGDTKESPDLAVAKYLGHSVNQTSVTYSSPFDILSDSSLQLHQARIVHDKLSAGVGFFELVFTSHRQNRRPLKLIIEAMSASNTKIAVFSWPLDINEVLIGRAFRFYLPSEVSLEGYARFEIKIMLDDSQHTIPDELSTTYSLFAHHGPSQSPVSFSLGADLVEMIPN